MILSFIFFGDFQSLGYSRKNPHPHNGRHAGKSHGRGVNGSGNPDSRGGFEPKNTSSGGNLIDFIDVSIASIAKFSEHCFAFSNFIILSKYRLLTTYILSFHP